MAINVIVQYNGGFLSDILLLLTQAPIFVYGSMALLFSCVITTLLTMYYILSSVLLCLVALHGDQYKCTVV